MITDLTAVTITLYSTNCTLHTAQVLQEISNLKFGLNIGDETRRDGGLSGSFKLIKIDTPAAYFRNLKVAADCGSVLILDWLFHADTTEEEAAGCANSVRQFLGEYLWCCGVR